MTIDDNDVTKTSCREALYLEGNRLKHMSKDCRCERFDTQQKALDCGH